ncbi:MAG: hypothetical protein Q9167_001652 [Letrouitia subvulpina]
MVDTDSPVPPRSYLLLDGSNATHQSLENAPVADRYHAFGSNVQTANLNRLASVGLLNSFGNPNVQADGFTTGNNIFPSQPSNAAQGVAPPVSPTRLAQTELNQSSSAAGYHTVHQRSLDGSLAVSDLEDGELNEGPDRPLPPPYSSGRSSSTRHHDLAFNKSQPQFGLQMDAESSSRPLFDHQAPGSEAYPRNTTSMTGALQFLALGADTGLSKVPSSNARLNDNVVAKDSLVVDHSTRINNTTSSASSATDMELKKAHSDAKTALEQLLLHNIGYSDVVGEGIDPEILSGLYEEIYVQEQAPSAEQPFTAKTRLQPRPNRNLVDKSLPQVTDFPPLALPNLTEHASSFLVEKTQNTTLPISKSNRDEASSQTVPRSAGQKILGNRISSPMQQGKHDHRDPESKFLVNATNSSGLLDTNVLSGDTEKKGKIVAKGKGANFTGNAMPSLSNHLSQAVSPLTTSVNQKKATTAAISTASSLGRDDKPLSRKDLIAQKLAERSGRNLPTSNGKAIQPVLEPSTERSTSKDKTGSQDRLSAARKTSEREVLRPDSLSEALPTGSVNAKPTKMAANATVRQDLDGSNNQLLAAEESHQPSKTLQRPHTGPQVTSINSSNLPPVDRMPGKTEFPERSQILSPGTFIPFSSPSANFSIPGLFMMSASPQTREQPQATETQDLSRPTAENESTSRNQTSMPQSEDRSSRPAISATTSGDLQSGIPNLPNEVSSIVTAGVPRKRPRASDFIEPPASSSKKIRPYRDDTQVVIEVSEDEDDDETDIDSTPDMAKYSNPIATQGHPSKPTIHSQTHSSQSTRNAATWNIPSRMKGTPKLSTNLNPIQQNPIAGKDQPELKTKEEEIKNMRGKIAEMERRMRAKQGVSRAQSPGTPGKSTVTSNLSGTIEQTPTAEPPDNLLGQAKAPHPQTKDNATSLTDTQSLEAKIQKQLVLEEQAAQAGEEALDDIHSKSRYNEDIVMRDGQLGHRKAELESDITKIDALLEKLSKQLQDLKHKEQETKQGIQKGIDGKRAILDELHALALAEQESHDASRGETLSEDDQRTSKGVEGVGKYLKYLDRNLPKQVECEMGSGVEYVSHHLIECFPASLLREATNDVAHDQSAYNDSSSEHPTQTLNKPMGLGEPADLPLSQSHSGELQGSRASDSSSDEEPAQDAMEISESEANETKGMEGRTLSSSSKILTRASVESDEDYEPPSASNVPSIDPMASFQSQKQLQENGSSLAASNARPVTVLSSPNDEQRSLQISGETENEQQDILTHHSDSDDYEPPETVISTNTPQLMHHARENTIDVPSEPTNSEVAEVAKYMSPDPIPVAKLPPTNPPSALNMSQKAGTLFK